MDGGVRSGVNVMKALASGARGVLVRPPLAWKAWPGPARACSRCCPTFDASRGWPWRWAASRASPTSGGRARRLSEATVEVAINGARSAPLLVQIGRQRRLARRGLVALSPPARSGHVRPCGLRHGSARWPRHWPFLAHAHRRRRRSQRAREASAGLGQCAAGARCGPPGPLARLSVAPMRSHRMVRRLARARPSSSPAAGWCPR